MNIKEYVTSLGIGIGQSLRSDCPFCGNKNTFSVSNLNGELRWICFHASCSLRGKNDAKLTMDSIRNISFPNRMDGRERWVVPSYFTYAVLNDRARKYCEYWRINKDFSLRYDPKRDRVVFLLEHKGDCYGAVGRSISAVKPRWLVYSRINSCPFLAKKKDGKIAVVVEDCISAIRVSSICNGIGILGTSMSDECIPYFLEYLHLYVALDDDATLKALKLRDKLKAFVPCSVLPLKKDIKYYSSSELKELENRIENDNKQRRIS